MTEVVDQEGCGQNKWCCKEGAATQTGEEERHCRCRPSEVLLLEVCRNLAFDWRVLWDNEWCTELG